MTKASLRNREWRKNNPVMYSYITLRDNTKRRGKIFDLTFKQFEKFCRRTDYIKNKGTTLESYTIDCIIPEDGYTIKNIQILKKLDNCKKGAKILEWNPGGFKVLDTYRPGDGKFLFGN